MSKRKTKKMVQRRVRRAVNQVEKDVPDSTGKFFNQMNYKIGMTTRKNENPCLEIYDELFQSDKHD